MIIANMLSNTDCMSLKFHSRLVFNTLVDLVGSANVAIIDRQIKIANHPNLFQREVAQAYIQELHTNNLLSIDANIKNLDCVDASLGAVTKELALKYPNLTTYSFERRMRDFLQDTLDYKELFLRRLIDKIISKKTSFINTSITLDLKTAILRINPYSSRRVILVSPLEVSRPINLSQSICAQAAIYTNGKRYIYSPLGILAASDKEDRYYKLKFLDDRFVLYVDLRLTRYGNFVDKELWPQKGKAILAWDNKYVEIHFISETNLQVEPFHLRSHSRIQTHSFDEYLNNLDDPISRVPLAAEIKYFEANKVSIA
jgi:hypothetical protein